MTLEGLESIGFIKREVTHQDELQKLYIQAGRKLADSKTPGLSNESRISFAYTTILICATIALRTMGYRVRPQTDYHYKTIETLRHTMNLTKKEVDYFQILREKRHQDFYGDTFVASDTDIEKAISESERMIQLTVKFVQKFFPDLNL